MNPDQLKTFIGSFWDDQILPSLTEYIRIPNKSPSFDPKVMRAVHCRQRPTAKSAACTMPVWVLRNRITMSSSA